MIVFRHEPSGRIFGTSRKVLSSLFTEDPNFTLINAVPVHYFITRNPYDRVVSLFFDKCRMTAIVVPDRLQINQKLLVSALGIDAVDLSEVSFERVCSVLPLVVNKDDHFARQTYGLALQRNGVLVRMESGLAELGDKLKINFYTRKNATVHPHWEAYCGPTERKIISEVYADDFRMLDYPT